MPNYYQRVGLPVALDTIEVSQLEDVGAADLFSSEDCPVPNALPSCLIAIQTADDGPTLGKIE